MPSLSILSSPEKSFYKQVSNHRIILVRRLAGLTENDDLM